MALALDSSTPAYASGADDPWVTASFTPPNDSLLVAVVTGDWFGGTPTFTITDSQGTLPTFQSVARYGSLNNGVVEILTCPVTTNGGVSRTISCDTNLTDNHGGMKVYVFTGQASSPIDLSSSTGINSGGFADPTNVNVATSLNDTWVIGGVVGWDGDGAITSTDTAESFNIGGTIETMVVRKGSARATPGTETVNINPAAAEAAGCYGFIGITSTEPPPYPTVPTTGNGRITSANQANTTATRTFPNLDALTINAGDLLIAIICAYQTSTGTDAAFSNWTGGFTEFHDTATSTTMAIGCAYKFADGTETGTFAVTQAGTITGHASMIVMSIEGAHPSTPPEAGGRNSGTSTAANATAVNPANWDVESTLWVGVAGSGEVSTTGSYTGITAAPTGFWQDYYDTGMSGDTAGATEAAVAFLKSSVASVDAGNFTVDTSNARSGAITIAVRPAPASAATNADAEVANVTTAALGPSRSVSATAGTAAVTVAANQPTVTTGKNADAQVANVTTAAGGPGGQVSLGSGAASVAAAALQPSRSVQVRGVGAASATGGALSPTGRVSPGAAAAVAASGAQSAVGSVGAAASPAAATAAANQPDVSTAANANAPAEVASVAAAALGAAGSPAVAPSTAGVTAAAQGPVTRVAPSPGAADAATAAWQAAAITGTFAQAQIASVAATALTPGGRVQLAAQAAGVTAATGSSPAVRLNAALAQAAAIVNAAAKEVGPGPATAAVSSSPPATRQLVSVGAALAPVTVAAGTVTMGVPNVPGNSLPETVAANTSTTTTTAAATSTPAVIDLP